MIIPEKLCELFNSSDIDAIEYIINNSENKEEKEKAMLLQKINMETNIGYGNRNVTNEEEEYYHNTFWKLLNIYNITKMDDDRACIEGLYYPSGI